MWQPFRGELVWFHGRAVDVLVTPNHRVLWKPDARNEERVSLAADILQRAAKISRRRGAGCIPAMSAWDAPDLTEMIFPGVRHSNMGPQPRSIRMTGDQFAAFMGMYMAEGSATAAKNDWLVAISQSPLGKGYDEYREVLTGIFGREPGKGNYGTTWVLHSHALYDYLSPLGKAVYKRLPREVLDLSSRQLEIFWRHYWLGDGSIATGGQEVAATATRRLADELQEVIQKIGWSASVREERVATTSLVKTKGIIYKLGVRKTISPAFSVDALPYASMIGGVSVPNGIVYVRRNGKPSWCGDSLSLPHSRRVST
jgi:hypothetical protein